MQSRLAALEARVEALVEGAVARLVGGRLQARDVLRPMARALEDAAAAGTSPVGFTLHLCPSDAQSLLHEQPRLAAQLAGEVVNLARELGLTLPRQPEIQIQPDPAMRPRALRVVPILANVSETGRTQGATAPAPDTPPPAPLAFLILDGQRTIWLDRPITSLGRRLDNHIILDDTRVSRAHAQVRLRFGRFVLYDLGSDGGTFVNGQRVRECVLRPGDVISLAGLPLIYGEEEPLTPRP